MYDFYKEYILLNLNDYSSINIDFPISLFLLCITLGVIIATVLVSYSRASMNLVVKRLIRYNAYDEGSAKTLDELKINSLGARILLSKSSPLTKIVKRVGERTYTYEEYSELSRTKGFKDEGVNFAEAKFYIPSDLQSKAKHVVDSPTPTILSTVLISLFLVAIYVCILFLLPGLLTLINNSLS